ncbi:DUF3108 domain-containing protein [Gallaecimonas sp. GXIMD4217]|uniref:DUF3108 domain-containing protein n=1 Tax=Gallaecimonas sp. GXIMD4217 TaxID=3131927 RepID=UPI00311B07E6
MAAAALLPLTSLAAEIAPMTPYDATYALLRKGKQIGVGTRSLHDRGDGQFHLSNQSDLRWLIFTDQRTEKADFQLKDGQILSRQYSYQRTGTGPDEEYAMRFDGQQITSGKAGIEVEDEAFDPLSYQQQLALDLAAGKREMSYTIVKELKTKHYRFRVAGEERIKTPYGELDTLRLERVRENSRRQTIFWLAPELNYALVKLWQAKDGIEQMELQLSDFKQSR